MSNSPVGAGARIEALDVLRGLAIFGILVVNVEQMFLPMAIANDPVAMIPGERGMIAAWAFTDALFENKFLTLFSLLFGVGFCLQWLRAGDEVQEFRRRTLRRLAGLIAFGVLHAAFFYKADVLVIYALAALVLFPFRRLSTRTLAATGTGMLVVTILWGAIISGPDAPESISRKQEVAGEIAAIREGGVVRLPVRAVTERAERAALRDPDAMVGFSLPLPERAAILVLDGQDDFEQAKVEYAVFSHGPVAAATFSRVSFLALLVLIYTPVYLLWRTLALFLIGAAIVKGGLLDARHRSGWLRVTRLGLGIGLPLTIAATALHLATFESQNALVYLSSLLHDLSSLLLAIGLGAGVLVICAGAAFDRLRRALATVGRTALSNYIGQSVAMSLFATSYGFGLFGDLTRLQILGLAVLCFLAQVVVSAAWLRYFRIGPLEWVWRCFTYWRAMPVVRSSR